MKPQLLRLTICLFLLMAGTYFSSSAQSKKVSFNTSSVVPGAEGTVKVKKDKNGNYAIDINIVNLAEPKGLTPPKKVYIVWMETAEKGIKSVGHINSSSSMFSKTKKASIETASSDKPVRIFVTAEDDNNVENPGTVVVLTTDSFW